jgi:hypothetical protein
MFSKGPFLAVSFPEFESDFFYLGVCDFITNCLVLLLLGLRIVGLFSVQIVFARRNFCGLYKFNFFIFALKSMPNFP